MHIDLLTPLLSTMERLRPRLNVQSVVGHRALLLWLRRRGVNPSARSSRAPLLLLPHTPRTGCLQRLPLTERGAHSRATSVSVRFAFRIVSRFELHHMGCPIPCRCRFGAFHGHSHFIRHPGSN